MEKTEFELFADEFADDVRSYRDRWVGYGKKHPEVSEGSLKEGFLSEVRAFLGVFVD